MRTIFVTATDTGVGKTTLTRTLAAKLTARGLRVAALKPIETGVLDRAEDACALAAACGEDALANAAGFYRARAPLAPYAAALGGEPACPSPQTLSSAIEAAARDFELVLVEGAGGPLVPLDAKHDVIDLAAALRAEVILVAPNRLGCISQTLAAFEAIERRARVAAVVLNRHADQNDESQRTNARIIAERVIQPVFDLDASQSVDDVADWIESQMNPNRGSIFR